MFPQRRMTTDTPDGNYEQALNLFVRGEDGWVQMPSRSISLNDYMKQLIKAHNADIDTEGTPEEFDMTLCEHLFDGPETIEGLLAEHYTLSWALASLRDKLKHYEDALIPEIMPEGLQTIDRAIGTYGKDAQLTKAVEEMSELTKALCKLKECKNRWCMWRLYSCKSSTSGMKARTSWANCGARTSSRGSSPMRRHASGMSSRL